MDKIKDDNIVISQAEITDIAEMESILKEANLPEGEILQHINNFLLLKVNDKIIGAIGLEIYEEHAILRSFAIRPIYQGKGFGLILFDKIIELSNKNEVVEIYLLTDSAVKFFEKKGFAVYPRTEVPEKLQNTFEFKTPRCSHAICMRYILSTQRRVK